MPLIQGGPPQWIWERPASLLKWEVVQVQGSNGESRFELRLNCGLEIVRLQFFSHQEIEDLGALIAGHGHGVANEGPAKPAPSQHLEGASSQQAPGEKPGTQETERSPRRKEGVFSDPDFRGKR